MNELVCADVQESSECWCCPTGEIAPSFPFIHRWRPTGQTLIMPFPRTESEV